MPEVQIAGGQGLPPEPGPGQLSVNCSTWSIFDEGDAFGRQWIIRGLRGANDIITVEIHVSAESIVTMVVEPGVEAGAVVNGGRIPGQRGGVKAGHWRWGAADMARAPIGALAISRCRDCSGDDLAGFGIGFV
ncbi:hypothetical protein, partial [Bosea massiliensis]